MQRIILISAIVLFSTPTIAAQTQEVFSAQFDIDRDGNVSDILLDTTTDTVSLPQGDGNYSVALIADDGRTFYEESFHISFIRYAIAGGREEVNETVVNMRIPYERNATSIEIRKHDNVLETIALPERLCVNDGTCRSYCDGRGIDIDCTCGDSVCQEHESEELCPQDCDPDYGEPNEEETTNNDTQDDDTDETPNPGIGGVDDDGGPSIGFYLMLVIGLLFGGALVLWFIREVET